MNKFTHSKILSVLISQAMKNQLYQIMLKKIFQLKNKKSKKFVQQVIYFKQLKIK